MRLAVSLIALLWSPAGLGGEPGKLASGYLEGAWARSSEHADGGESTGRAIGLRLPISDDWFATASAQTLDAYIDDFGNRSPDEVRRSLGIGVRRGKQDSEQYARLVFIDISDWRSGPGEQRAKGGALSIGARALYFVPWLEGTIEGGFGKLRGDEGEGDFSFAGRAELAAQLGPSFTLYAARFWEDTSYVQVGLRLNFAHFGRRSGPAVRASGRSEGPLLAAGQDVVARRPLQLQVRPAFGAPETIVVPAGETLALVATLRNDFGNWWRVSWNGEEGWIREGWLLRAE